MFDKSSKEKVKPEQIRTACRDGSFSSQTSGLALGYVQANLVVLEEKSAFDFMLFCHRNPKPCPLLDITDIGGFEPRIIAPGADIRTDLPRYRVFREGVIIDEPADIIDYWRDDLVAFLVGCSFTFENAMLKAGLPIRNIEQGTNVPMYRTNIPCTPAGRFSSQMVVSMRPLTSSQTIRAVNITSRYARAHGAPVHFGNPHEIGIEDINTPDFGEPVEIRENEAPVFWACGVTPQVAIETAQPSFAITHAPGHMFVSDIKDDKLAN